MKIYEENVKGPLLIAPIGDIQFTGTDARVAAGCSVSGVRAHFQWLKDMAKSLKAQLSIIGVGDYVDLLSPSNRLAYKRAGLYTNALRLVDVNMSDVTNELADIFRDYFLEDDYLVLLRGHHWFEYNSKIGDFKYTDTDDHLSHILGAKHDSWPGACYVEYTLPNGAQYNVVAAHGEGNGQSLAYGLNKLDKQAGSWAHVHAHLMAHTHKLGSVKKAQLEVIEGEIINHDIRLITTGAFLRGWMKDELMYPERLGLPALPIGGSAIYVEASESDPSGHSSFALLR